MVALMSESLKLKKHHKVLEVGTGSGYQTAILAEMCSEVYSIERIAVLTQRAQRLLGGLGYKNVYLVTGDGSCGWQEHAPYDGIIVTCASPSVPEVLKEQLASGGRLVIPVGGDFTQILTVVENTKDSFSQHELCGCVFVPLIGKYGWKGYD
jgi:protein-L-isoaspartate(D-aspartate) O-methyltransferase